MPTLNYSQLSRDEHGIRDAKIIIIDEISNVSPYVLARLNQVCQNATGNTTQPFGGIRLLFVGDLCQKPPVFGVSLAQGVLQVHRDEQLRNLQIQRAASLTDHNSQEQQTMVIPGQKRLLRNIISDC